MDLCGRLDLIGRGFKWPQSTDGQKVTIELEVRVRDMHVQNSKTNKNGVPLTNHTLSERTAWWAASRNTHGQRRTPTWGLGAQKSTTPVVEKINPQPSVSEKCARTYNNLGSYSHFKLLYVDKSHCCFRWLGGGRFFNPCEVGTQNVKHAPLSTRESWRIENRGPISMPARKNVANTWLWKNVACLSYT